MNHAGRLALPLRALGSVWLAATLGYLGLTLLVLAPVLPGFATAIPGGPVADVDGWQNVWNLWWFHRAVSAGQNPFFTDLLFHPTGATLATQTLSSSNGLLVLPVTALAGPIAGYNAAILLSFALAGLGGFALTLHVTRQPVSAFVAGCVFAFAPFHMTKVWDGQLELAALQWLPWYALFLLRSAAPEGSWGDAALAGALLGLIGYTSWYYFFFAGIASLFIAALWLPYRAGPRALGRVGLRLAAAAGLATLVLAPLLPPLVRGALEQSGPASSMALLADRSANLVDFWLPSNLHPLWGDAARALGESWHPYIAAWNVALGFTPLLLALAALGLNPGASWRWAALGLAAGVLALGPVLQVGPWRTDIPLPYAVLAALPGGNLAHRPSHFVIISVVALTVLAGLGLQALTIRAAGVWRAWLPIVALLGIGIEFFPPRWSLWEPSVHPYYVTLTDAPGALLVLPPPLEDSRALLAQMRHQRPILGGFLARTPPYDPPFAPGVRELWAPRDTRPPLLAASPEQGRAALRYYGVSHIVVERSLLESGVESALEGVIAGLLPGVEPEYADETLRVYPVPEGPDAPFAFIRSGWYPPEREADRVWSWMADTGVIVLVNPAAAPLPVTLSFTVASYRQPRELYLDLEGAPVARLTVQPADTRLALRLLAPPGDHRLNLRALAEPEAASSARPISVVFSALDVRWGRQE